MTSVTTNGLGDEKNSIVDWQERFVMSDRSEVPYMLKECHHRMVNIALWEIAAGDGKLWRIAEESYLPASSPYCV